MSLIPAYPATFRFPYGTCSQESLDVLADAGIAAVQWSIVTGDPRRAQSSSAIAAQILQGAAHSPGSIIIAHANGRGWNTPGALPQVSTSSEIFVGANNCKSLI